MEFSVKPGQGVRRQDGALDIDPGEVGRALTAAHGVDARGQRRAAEEHPEDHHPRDDERRPGNGDAPTQAARQDSRLLERRARDKRAEIGWDEPTR